MIFFVTKHEVTLIESQPLEGRKCVMLMILRSAKVTK